jgi:polyhydroxyalkanoate synthesis repressor PhaR
MPDQSILIRKYENRRLYDATNSHYVNLEEVAQLVQRGYDVQAVDAASGEDITRVVLTQIIAEAAKGSGSNFPLDILRQIVIASGRAAQESATPPAPAQSASDGKELPSGATDEMSKLRARIAELEKAILSIAPQRPTRVAKKTTRKISSRKPATPRK